MHTITKDVIGLPVGNIVVIQVLKKLRLIIVGFDTPPTTAATGQ
jgi:hypothetical protein